MTPPPPVAARIRESASTRRPPLAGWLPLAGVLVLGAALRFVGLGWGIPAVDARATALRSSYHFDEDDYLWSLVRSARTGTGPDLHWGTLQLHLIDATLAAAHRIGWLRRPWADAFVERDSDDFPRLYRAARAVSALAGVLTIVVVFALGRRIGGRETGLGAAAVVAASPLHVVMSHFLTADTTMVLLATAALYAFAVSLDDDGGRAIVAAGVLLGLAIAAKYNAAWLVPLWLARDLAPGTHRRGLKAAGYAAIAAGFALGAPYAALHPGELARVIYDAHLAPQPAAAAFRVGRGELLFDQLRTFGYYGLTVGPSALAAVSLAAWLRSRDRRRLALAAAALLLAATIPMARWPMARYTLPLVPIAAVAAASVVPRRWTAGPRLALQALLVVPPFAFSAAQVAILRDEHPAEAARRWIEAHVPAGSRVGQVWADLPPLDGRRYDLRLVRPFAAGAASGADCDVLILDDLPLAPWSTSFAESVGREYVAVAQFRADPRLGPWQLPEPTRPHDWKYTHPVIRIYRKR